MKEKLGNQPSQDYIEKLLDTRSWLVRYKQSSNINAEEKRKFWEKTSGFKTYAVEEKGQVFIIFDEKQPIGGEINE